MELKNIAILGPGGNVGTALITELLKDGARFNITGIGRATSNYPPPTESITTKTVDYSSFDSLKEAFSGQDAVVNCITGGATQYDPSKLIIDAAIAAGVRFFFANEFVGDISSEQFRRLPESAAGAKGRIREYLESLAKEEKIKWTALNGGPFFDMWLMKGPAGFDIANRRARIYGTGNNSMCWTPLTTIALAAANMLRNPEPILNRPIHISPIPGLTQNVILAAVERVLGTKFTVTNIDVAKINGNARIALERGEVTKAMRSLTISYQFYEGDKGNDFTGKVENETVGVEQQDVEDAVRDAIKKWGEDSAIVETMYNVVACEV